MGTFIRDPFGLVEVCGMGWEGDSFVLHVRDVFTSPHAAELLDDYWEPGEAMAARDAFGMEDE